jgi:PAS domain S-box-containing protein
VLPDVLARVLRQAILRRRMDQSLRESEAELRALFELNPHAIWVFELPTLSFLAANSAAIQQYGWTLEQFLGMRVTDIRPPEEIPQLLDYLHGDLVAGADRIWRHRTRDGRELQVQLSAHRLNFYGKPAVLVLTRNVNENAQLAHAVEIGERRFRDLFDVCPTALFEHDLDGTILSSNAAAAKALGHPSETINGANIMRFAPMAQTDNIDRYLAQLRDGGHFDGVLAFMIRGPRRRYFQLRSRRYDNPGHPPRVIALAQEMMATVAATEEEAESAAMPRG